VCHTGRVPLLLPTLEATAAFASKLAKGAPTGTLLILLGPLGVGKTTLVQHLGRALGSTAHISSPTYTLIHEYPTPEGPLVHLDAYRLGGDAGAVQALFDLGLDDYLGRARLVAAEWGEGFLQSVPEAWVVRLEPTTGGARRVTVTQRGQVLF
jgi:tRNA threonylcarbamoyladenosine biosynthesis protein TsaE